MTTWGGRRPTVAGVFCAVLLAVGAAGCGIPANSEVQVDGSGPAVEAGASSFRKEPPTRTASGTNRGAFVDNFLSAAAGEPERAYTRVRQFIDRDSRNRLPDKPGNETVINVIRLTDRPVITENVGGDISVVLTVEQVGQLRADGVLSPPVATEDTYRFSLRNAGQEGTDEAGFYVTDPPNVLLMSTDALRQYYQPRNVYFWNFNQNRLVADQRYLPQAVASERLVSEVVRWLTGGPSDWLGQGVARLPKGTNLINNAVETDGRWEVALDLPGDDHQRLEQLATQLAWSLPDLHGQLQLTTRNQSQVRIDDLDEHRLAHPLYPLGDGPQPFTVYDGAIHPLSFPEQSTGTVPLTAAANRGIVSAAIRRADDRFLAALVTTAPGDRQRLRVGYGADPLPATHESKQTFPTIGRPVWLRSLDPAQPYGLVAAGGRLFRFDDGADMVAVPLNVPGAVSAVAASLDGQRIALIVGGKLYVAVVSLDGGGVSLGPARAVPTSLTDLSAVDWAAENALVVAGSTAERAGVYEVGVDGTVETPLVSDVGARVTHLAAYPTNPVLTRPGALIMYQANGVAYRYPSAEKILGDQVLDVTPPPAGRSGSPTAPFFLF